MRLYRLFSFFLFIFLLWEIVLYLFQLPNYILPKPQEVFVALIKERSIILHHAMMTLNEAIIGLLLGVLFASIAAILMSASKTLSAWFLPILIISQSIPTFAIAPLLVIWFGFGFISKIATTVLMLFFPMTSALFDGLNRTNQSWLELANTMQATKWRVFWYIRIPAALPSFASGLRIATVIAPIGAIVGEWVGSSQGLGYLMLNANARLQIDVMFAALIVIMLFSVTLYFLVDLLLKKTIWW